MDLVSDRPYWLLKNGLLASYPALEADRTCEVAVIGAGISGALIADRLTKAGIETIVLDRRDVAQGSTSATTSLVQYEIDTHLTELIKLRGLEQARRAYLLGIAAISKLEDWVSDLAEDVRFQRKSSLYIASEETDVRSLAEECEARRECGIEVEFLGPAELKERFALNYPAALVSAEAAQLDAYRLTHRLFERNLALGLQVYDRTEVTRYEQLPDGVKLHTKRGPVVTAQRLIVAAGYESQEMLKEKVVELKSTYALVTQPLPTLSGWVENHLLWESSRPYCYLRTTDDKRILFGGEDDNFRSPTARDASLPLKTEKLLARCQDFFPTHPLEEEYSWAGTFGETKDGLAYIGATPEFPHAYFALGFGGNGITFSVMAAEMMPEFVRTGRHPDAELFCFGR